MEVVDVSKVRKSIKNNIIKEYPKLLNSSGYILHELFKYT